MLSADLLVRILGISLLLNLIFVILAALFWQQNIVLRAMVAKIKSIVLAAIQDGKISDDEMKQLTDVMLWLLPKEIDPKKVAVLVVALFDAAWEALVGKDLVPEKQDMADALNKAAGVTASELKKWKEL